MNTVERLERAGEGLSPGVRAAIEALEVQLATALARIQDLERRLGMTLRNSSRPPSSDPPGGIAPSKPRGRGRTRGAQPGHEPHQRQLLPPERVDRVVEPRPAQCRHCGHSVAGAWDVGEPERRQAMELPPVHVEVTEHRLFRVRCAHCQRATKAEAPAGVEAPITWGSRLVSLAAVLTVRLRASRRNLRLVLGDLLDIAPPRRGCCSGNRRRSAKLSCPPTGRRAGRCAGARAVRVDETGWWRRRLRHGLWTGATRQVSVFRLTRRRTAAERERLLGRRYAGVVTSDRAGPYAALSPEQRQVCWAHLTRDFTGWQGYGGRAARLGQWAVAECGRLFQLWHQFRYGEIGRAEFRTRMQRVQMRVSRLLYRAAEVGEPKVEGMATRLLVQWPALWSFVEHEEGESTDNEAERSLRTGVIWRKTSFGSQSEPGMRMVERLLTVAETAKKQQRDLFRYVCSAVQAYRLGQPAPPRLC